jgi:TRAP transporter 4TM/12TM fusion protein
MEPALKPVTSSDYLFASAGRPLAKTSYHWLVAVLCVFYVFIHVYIGFYNSPDSQLLNSLHVNSALALVFLTMPLLPRTSRFYITGRAIDALAILGCLWCQIYFLNEIETWSMRTLIFRPIDYFTAILFTALILEACRRAVGMVLVVICLVLMLYALNADHMAGMFYGAPVSFTRLLQTIFLGSAGIFGVAVSVMVQYVVLFILFGVLLNSVGGGRFFTRLAFALFAHRRGGPAKAAVVSSGMLGTMSGSAIGNVVTTGIFTIPLMIRLGYKRAFAGGVEAAASNGGMIAPPVMGAVAFIMADLMGRSYLEIVTAAIIPAILYYVVMFVTVDLEARKLGLAPIEKGKLPSALSILRKQGYYLAPLVVIGFALAMGYSIILVAVLTICVTFVIGLMQRTDRLDPARLMNVVEETARSTAGLSATAAAAGIMLGAIFAVGLSFQVAQEAARLADGNLWVLVLLCGVMAIIMGMGMSAAAVYLTLAATIIPILQLAGVPQMAAHFYAFYYGIASNITPPVALTAYAAAPIAGSKPIETGVHAARLGISCLLLPILFIYQPAILMIGTWPEIIIASGTSLLALLGFAAVTTGYLFRRLSVIERLAGAAASALLFIPEALTDIAGLVLVIALSVYFWMTRERGAVAKKAEPEREESTAAEISQDGWIARFMKARMAKETDPSVAVPTRSSAMDESEILDMLAADAPTDAASEAARRRFTPASLTLAWAVVLVVAGIFHYCGTTYLHARDPRLWTALMVVASLITVTGIWGAVRFGAAKAERLAAATA